MNSQFIFPKCRGPYRILDQVVIDLQATVIAEAQQRWPQRQRIRNGFSHLAAGPMPGEFKFRLPDLVGK